MVKTPIFIFSLPRSGSTLVQRLIGVHPEVATVPEPWLLLPFLYTLKSGGVYSEYVHRDMVRAIEDFCKNLPGGQREYLEEIRKMVLSLYERAGGSNARFFLDKTPRYHLIVEEITALFPEAKFIFLWRNPLAMAASMIETFGRGRWNLFMYKVDLYDGLENLTKVFEASKKKSVSLCYEDLIADPNSEMKRVFEYLGLEWDEKYASRFHEVKVTDRMGDPVGTKKYRTITPEPLKKWRGIMANPIRKAWCRRYIRWIGKERLSLMGYEQGVLLDELRTSKTKWRFFLSDLIGMVLGVPFSFFEPASLFHKIKLLPNWKKIRWHS